MGREARSLWLPGADHKPPLCGDRLGPQRLYHPDFLQHGLQPVHPASGGPPELALGIKDNVEDIAATFKKMAIINPRRERVRTAALPVVAAVEETAAVEELPVAVPVQIRTVDAENKQALYDGLLQRTLEQRKQKKSKKKPVDENQLSFFDFVA